MRNNNISDPFDSLTCTDIQHTDQPIDVYEELRRIGFSFENRDWFTSREPRYTCHFCRRIITNPVAGSGGVSRLELYQNRNEPQHGFAVAYQVLPDTHARLNVHNRFISNDPEYNARHSCRMTERLRCATREEIQRILETNFFISSYGERMGHMAAN